MRNECFRALVIDDDYVVRNLTTRALRNEGFTCDVAADGLRGAETLAAYRYDVVVTDLRMPGKNGHALACELLARDDRPVIVVLTGVMEPKLTTDLVARGVDYVEFKPVQYDLFAAKVKGLIERANHRSAVERSGGKASHESGDDPLEAVAGKRDAVGPRSRDELLQELSRLSKILPIPQAALDVYRIANSEDCATQQIAAGIARNASLSLDVLRLANTSFYCPSGVEVVSLDDAVLRIGRKRIGELALATGMMAVTAANALPWMDLELVWRRSLAAGVAVDALLEGDEYTAVEEGLFLGAIIHPLGRIALATLFPQDYEEMFHACKTLGTTLAEQEERRFAMTPGEVIGHLLAEWKLPPEIYEPLQLVTDSYSSLASRAEPLRTKAELLRLAVLIGQNAVGKWEPSDRLEFPPAYTLRRLHIDFVLAEMIAKVRAETLDIIDLHPRSADGKVPAAGPGDLPPAANELTYCNLSPEPFDFLAPMISAMGIALRPASPQSLRSKGNVLINCIRAQPDALRALGRGSLGDGKQVVVADSLDVEHFAPLGEVVTLPCSYQALHAACQACILAPDA